MGRPLKTLYFPANLSYGLPYVKIISSMINITPSVILNKFLMPRTMLFMDLHFSSSDFSKSRRLWRLVTIAIYGIMD